MEVESLNDFRIILTGQSREYPGFKGNDWSGRGNIREHYDWLMDINNRTVEVDGEVSYKDGLWGGVKPELV